MQDGLTHAHASAGLQLYDDKVLHLLMRKQDLKRGSLFFLFVCFPKFVSPLHVQITYLEKNHVSSEFSALLSEIWKTQVFSVLEYSYLYHKS